ncbi:MAG: hypothetical protein N2Z72_08405 [Bacteroidales bacterium]|nr:hypothetical protein [Bacteroidales bacterium]
MNSITVKDLAAKIEHKHNLDSIILEQGQKALNLLKKEFQLLLSDLRKNMNYLHHQVVLQLKDKGDYEFECSIGEKALAFFLPNHVYDTGLRNGIFPISYLFKQTSPENRLACIIHVYYFKTDSLFNQRANDMGILLARIFINKDYDCIVEGKGELGVITPSMPKPMGNLIARKVIVNAIHFLIDLDFPQASFQEVEKICVQDYLTIVDQTHYSQTRKIGFQSKWDNSFK